MKAKIVNQNQEQQVEALINYVEQLDKAKGANKFLEFLESINPSLRSQNIEQQVRLIENDAFKRAKEQNRFQSKIVTKKVSRVRSLLKLDGDESETELPPAMKIIRPKISDQEFLKMYQQKNNIHSQDRESAINIAMNITMPK
ncbi:UNKNOWN [Stylonychia lemnae]|uniref:Uncharacterized protein n=1 Tax=Stylonychia lemnae TaxID=5949 RepID=A0A078B0W0_STYLE|nr:UNKNOWN [Stylonychia lemnae]|eukprot:CDW88280.1 UNKNOWN [Stylonychia lemnae]